MMKCPKIEPHEPHWHTIRTDGVTVAGGPCAGEGREPSRQEWEAEAIRLVWGPPGERLPDDATAADVRRIASERTGYWPDQRDPECVARWPEAETGAYDPRCCRFPKSCSADVRQ